MASDKSGFEPLAAPPHVLPFTEAEMLGKILATPLDMLLLNAVEYPHDGMHAGTGLTKLQNWASERLQLSEADERRIFIDEEPTTPEEIELKLVVELRGAFGAFVNLLVQDPGLPQSVKQDLMANAIEFASHDKAHSFYRSMIINDYCNLVKVESAFTRTIPEPIYDRTYLQTSAELSGRVGSLYVRAAALLEFYQAQGRIQVHDWSSPTPEEWVGLQDTEDQLRVSVIQQFIRMFSPAYPVDFYEPNSGSVETHPLRR